MVQSRPSSDLAVRLLVQEALIRLETAQRSTLSPLAARCLLGTIRDLKTLLTSITPDIAVR
jgi:hypothetical protein